MKHLNALQDIADTNDGTRAAGTSGYAASGDYVEGVLEAAGYDVTRQVFDIEYQAPEARADLAHADDLRDGLVHGLWCGRRHGHRDGRGPPCSGSATRAPRVRGR